MSHEHLNIIQQILQKANHQTTNKNDLVVYKIIIRLLKSRHQSLPNQPLLISFCSQFAVTEMTTLLRLQSKKNVINIVYWNQFQMKNNIS